MKAVAVVVAAVVVAVLVAGVSGRGADLRTSADLPKEIEKIVYTTVSETKICLKSSTIIPESETVTMVRTIGADETDFAMTTKQDNCGLFSAPKPDDGQSVEYSVFFESAGDPETGEVKAHVDFTFAGKSGTQPLSCGGQNFERSLRADETNAAADCLDDDDARDYCYKLASPSPDAGDGCSPVDGNGFQYCQKTASDLTLNNDIAYVKSLSYGGEITLEKASSDIELDTVIDVIVVQDVAGQTTGPKVLSYTAPSVTLNPFTRGADGGKYTVCAVRADDYSQSSIEDINIIGKYDAGYYQFGFKYTTATPSSYTAVAGGNPVTIDCSALNPSADTRCYGYLQESVDTNDLTVSFDVEDANALTRELSIIVKSTELEV